MNHAIEYLKGAIASIQVNKDMFLESLKSATGRIEDEKKRINKANRDIDEINKAIYILEQEKTK